MPKQNHVIFLGAGASRGSGYPIGNDLRLMLSDIKTLRRHLNDERPLGQSDLAPYALTIELFRKGGFGTVDEFSKLIGRNNPQDTVVAKKLMRLAFFLLSPEDAYDKSEYYPFIQRLFEEERLHFLKPHITIVSYNYDCYLDYLLLRAYKARMSYTKEPTPNKSDNNRLTSGFFDLSDTKWTEQHNRFTYFKLHGSVDLKWPVNKPTNANEPFHHLFESDLNSRITALRSGEYKEFVPPIIFPWELWGEPGEFATQADFDKLFKTNSANSDNISKNLRPLYTKIWQGAQAAVTRADKISFVGLSMHPYLSAGWKYLFKERNRGVEIVIANRENRNKTEGSNRAHSGGLRRRVEELLGQVAPALMFPPLDSVSTGETNSSITLRNSFTEFIQQDMD
jgi:hypothetical protein